MRVSVGEFPEQDDQAAQARKSGTERRRALEQLVLDRGYAATSELAAGLGVSEMTIRRDIAKLEQRGRLRNVHGGVTAILDSDLGGSEFEDRRRLHTAAKKAVAKAALRFLPRDGILALDAGTTTAAVVPLLPADRSFTVVTYSLPVMMEAVHHPNIELVNLGGVFHRYSLSYSGPMTIRAIENLRITTLYLGASSVSERGLFCGNEFDAVTKRALIDAAETVVLLTDSSKFRKIAMVRICELDQIDHVVVDGGIDEASLALVRGAGIEPTLVARHS